MTPFLPKNILILVTLLMFLSEIVDLNEDIHLNILKIVNKMCTNRDDHDQVNLGKVFFNHITNRILSTKIKI